MKPKIHATFNVYNEAQFIGQAIQSVLWCDRIVIVDGAFKGFPASQPQSNDGTLEIAAGILQKAEKDHLFFQFDKYVEGYEKTDKMLEHISNDDYILRMNGDEVVRCNPKLLPSMLTDHIEDTGYLPLYTIPMYDSGNPDGVWYQPRLIKKTPKLKITSKHLALTNDFEPKYEVVGPRGWVLPLEANIEFMAIEHFKEKRDEERKKQNAEWIRYYYAHQYKKGII